MADDWQAGDLALCVDNSNAQQFLRKGRIYTVLAVPADERIDLNRRVAKALIIRGVHFRGGRCSAYRFRKIRPHTPDAEDAETIRLLTGKPVKEPVA